MGATCPKEYHNAYWMSQVVSVLPEQLAAVRRCFLSPNFSGVRVHGGHHGPSTAGNSNGIIGCPGIASRANINRCRSNINRGALSVISGPGHFNQ
jgi:hypothetical protein